MIVALDAQGRGRYALKQIMRDSVAAAIQMNRRSISTLKARNVEDSAILDEVPARGQRLAVPAGHACPAAAECVHDTAENAMMLTALNDNCITTELLYCTIDYQTISSTANMNPVATSLL